MVCRSLERLLVLSATASSLLVAGCSGDDDAESRRDDPEFGNADASGPVSGTPCADTDDCGNAQVCHPHLRVCVARGRSCNDQSECTGGTYCESAAGVCLVATSGSPCASNDNCTSMCTGGFCGCDSIAHERQLEGGPLDVYLILDRTASMGEDCAYVRGDAPPASSKACFATYALSDYLIDVSPAVDTRLAFHFMSQEDDCDGGPYTTPLIDLTTLPVAEGHALIQTISDETFEGGLGTHIEGALRGLAQYTVANESPDREMVGVLMTDGDPSGCEEDIGQLRDVIASHFADTGIRTFIIGMEGASEDNLEELAMAGGGAQHNDWCGSTSSPCYHWNVGDGAGAAIAGALQGIIQQAAPLPCELSVAGLEAPAGETLDYDKVNVVLTEDGVSSTIGRAPNAGACPDDQPAWYYDDPGAPTRIHLCESACRHVSGAGDGTRVDVVVGCEASQDVM
jgi:hypothetical protein